jgi:RNA polymerase sigma factor (sigma-70 family)
MSVYVRGMKQPKKELPNANTQEFLGLEAYLKMTRKVVVYILGAHNPMTSDILKSEDAISNIATSIMMADWKFDPNHNVLRSTYRYGAAKQAIMSYITSRKKKRFHYSLDTKISIDGVDVDLHAVLQCPKQKTPEAEIAHEIDLDLMERYVHGDEDLLKPREKTILDKYFYQNTTLEEIGEELDVSRQRVHQIVGESIKKLKTVLGE